MSSVKSLDVPLRTQRSCEEISLLFGFAKLCLACNRKFIDDLMECPLDGTQLVSLGRSPFPGLVDKAFGGEFIVAKSFSDSMCVVFRKDGDEKFVLKVSRPENSLQKTAAANEAELYFAVKHRAICQLLRCDVDFPSGILTLQEHAKGSRLSTLIAQGTLSPKEAISVIVQIASGLESAHEQGLVHGYLRPENLIVDRLPDGTIQAKLCGFSLMPRIRIHSLTTLMCETLTSYLGYSPMYAPPEGPTSGPFCDIYSLGCVLFECITGSVPYKGATSFHTALQHGLNPVPSLQEICPELPEAALLDPLIQRSMAKRPAKRFSSMNEFKTVLEGIYQGVAAETSRAAEPLFNEAPGAT